MLRSEFRASPARLGAAPQARPVDRNRPQSAKPPSGRHVRCHVLPPQELGLLCSLGLNHSQPRQLGADGPAPPYFSSPRKLTIVAPQPPKCSPAREYEAT